MARVNFSGIAGVVLGCACAWVLWCVLMAIEEPKLESFAWCCLAGCFATSMFGLFVDRSVVPDFWRSYRTLLIHQLTRKRGGPDWHPRERMAMFWMPIAFMTVLVPIFASIYLTSTWDDHALDLSFVAIYFAAGVAALAATIGIGKGTVEHRLLQREIAFNTTPRSPEQQVVPVKKIVGPPTEADLERSRTGGRLNAVLVIMLGLWGLALNHSKVLNEHKVADRLIFGGAMAIMMGVFGLFQPLIMTRDLTVRKYYTKTIVWVTLVALAAGMVGAWEIEAY